MNPQVPSHFRLTELWWRGIILALSLTVLLFSIWCLMHGITTIFMHLYYFPIVLLAYHYRWKGFGLAMILALAYLSIVIVFDPSQTDVILGAFYRFLVFVGIAAVIAYLSDRIASSQGNLQQSAEIRDRYLSLAPAIILVLDRNGAITYLNKKGSEILQCEPDDVNGKNWADLFLPEKDRERVNKVFSELIDGQVEPNRVFENRVLTFGGNEKIIRWYNTVLHDENGTITGTLGFGEDITEERWAQDTLREMQQFQESVIANANVWISVLEPDGTLLVWNDAAEAISGYKKTGVLGKRTVWKQLYPDNEYRKKVTGEIQRVIGQDTYLEDFETEIQCADGTKKTIVWNTRGLRDNSGTVTSYIAIGRDVTAQKSAESRAVESSRFLATMIDTLPMPIFFKDTSGKYLGCNPPFEEYIGIKCDSLIGKTAYDISPKDLADKYTAADRQLFDNPVPQRYETQVQYADGSLHDVIFYKAPFLNKDGSLGGLIGAFLDITDRKRYNEALKESESFNRGLVENLPDYVAVYSLDGILLYVNPSSAKGLGYDADTLVGTHVLTYVAKEYHETVIAKMTARTDGGDTSPYEIDMVTKDGARRSVIVKATTIQYQNKPAILLLLIDITDRKRMEEELRESEAYIKAVMDSLPVGVAVNSVDPTISFTYMNDNFARFYRTTREELAQPNAFWDAVYEDPALREKMKKKVLEDCDSGDLERMYWPDIPITRQGEETTFVTARNVPVPDKKIMISTVWDVTGRKRAEEEIRLSNVILTTQQETSPDGILIVDESGKILTFNKRFTEIWEITQEVIDSRSDERALSSVLDKLADPEEFLTRVKNLYEHKEEKSREEILLKDGHILERYSAPMLGEDNRYFGRVWYFQDITERKHAEEALRKSRVKLTEAMDLAHLVNWEYDVKTGIFTFDDRFYAMYGTTAEREGGNQMPAEVYVREFVHPEDHGVVAEESEKAINTTDPDYVAQREHRIIRRDGEIRNIIVRIGITKDAEGKTIKTYGGNQDITERKQMEKQINESRQLFADIISFLPDPTFVIDKEGKVLAWNRAIEQLSGVPAHDIIGKGDHEYSLWMSGKRRPIFIDLVLHPDQDYARMNYTGIQMDGLTVTGQYNVILPDGRKTVLSLVASPLFDVQGNIVGAIESIRDITRIKDTEAELARLNENLETIVKDRTRLLEDEVAQRIRAEKDVQTALDYTRSVIEANPDLMVVIDAKGIILDVNAAGTLLTGIPKEKLIGSSYFNYLVDDGTHFNKFSSLLHEGKLENFIEIQRTDGHVTPLSVHAMGIRGDEGGFDRFIVAAHDITRQKHDEEAIRASLDEKVILLREVHHRVKNNLQIIISLVNLQMRQTDDPMVKQIMSETQNRVRAMSLVHEKLYRSDSLSRIDFADYTRFLATQLFSFYGTDSQRVRLDFVMSKIMVDINTAVPLGLLMNELISNTLKHAFPEGRAGTISISGEDTGDLITLVVRDNGIGIPADLDWKNTTSLGMRLVTSLIDQIDGTITLDRSAGTAFSIILKKKD